MVGIIFLILFVCSVLYIIAGVILYEVIEEEHPGSELLTKFSTAQFMALWLPIYIVLLFRWLKTVFSAFRGWRKPPM